MRLVDKLTLSFEPSLEREYRYLEFLDSVTIVRFGLFLGILLYAVFGILDAYILPITKYIAWFIRFALVLPVLTIVYVLSYQRIFQRYSTGIMLVTSLILGYGILAMIFFAQASESGYHYYYSGLMLVIIWTGTFSQMRFVNAASSILLIILGFFLVAIFRQDMVHGGFSNPQFPVFINNSFFFVASAIVALVSSYTFEMARRNSFIQRKNMESEKRKSDKLLLNILPESVAEEIKIHGKANPQIFPDVTVLLTDIVGFTELSAKLEPEVLINTLNALFTAFDNIIEKNRCERIKTIGDAYMAVSGMPKADIHHAINIALSSLEFVDYCKQRNVTHPVKLEVRIGIHTGKVVGAVVGIKKYIYDVFGTPINYASRMQSHSEPMKINISESTYHLIKDHFICSERSLMPVKGLGMVKMYFLEGEKQAAMSDLVYHHVHEAS